MKKNPWTKQLTDIKLQGQQPLRAVPGQIKRVIDYPNDLDFVAQVNPDTGNWIAVAPITPANEAKLSNRPIYHPRNRPGTIRHFLGHGYTSLPIDKHCNWI